MVNEYHPPLRNAKLSSNAVSEIMAVFIRHPQNRGHWIPVKKSYCFVFCQVHIFCDDYHTKLVPDSIHSMVYMVGNHREQTLPQHSPRSAILG